MWVIYNVTTGQEVTTEEHLKNANAILLSLNDNEFGIEFKKRWEDR